MSSLWQDFRYALRQLRKNPGVTVVAVITLALGIGANSTVFSVINGLFLRRLPVSEPERLVAITSAQFSYTDYADLRDQLHTFEGLAASYTFPLASNLNSTSPPDHVFGGLVTGNFFTVLGVRPVRGRVLVTGDDDLAAPLQVVMLSYRLWQRRFGGDPQIVGRTIRLNNIPFAIVGVAPRDFTGSDFGVAPDYWAPMSLLPRLSTAEAKVHPFTNRHEHGFEIIGRLKRGVPRQQALAEVNLIYRRLYSSEQTEVVQSLIFETPGTLPGVFGIGSFTGILMAVAGLVLLIACLNLTNVLFARTMNRRKELAVRMAVGSSRGRAIQELILESLLLSLLGAAAALLLSFAATRAIAAVEVPLPLPVILDFTPDLRVVLVTMSIAVIASLMFGLAPALRVVHLDVATFLKEGSVASGLLGLRLRTFLIASQVALCVVVLTAAGLFLRSLRNASSIDLGFHPENILVCRIDPVSQGYSTERTIAFFQQLEKQVSRMPGVRSSSLVAPLPLGIFRSARDFTQPSTGKSINADVHVVGAQYFQVIGVPLLRGRDFRDVSATAPLAAVVNQVLAQRLFAKADPLGKVIEFQWGDEKTSYEIVGVVGNTKTTTIGEELKPVVYEFVDQTPKELEGFSSFGGISLITKTTGNPAALTAALQHQVEQLDPDMPIYGVETMEEQVGKALLLSRLSAAFLGIFGCLALTLAGVGLYGVVSYSVACRTREIAIRAALGAPLRRTLASLTLQGFGAVAAGLIFGLAGSLVIGRIISGFLYGVQGADPLTFFFVPVLLAGVALTAIFAPAWHAAHVNPAQALRTE